MILVGNNKYCKAVSFCKREQYEVKPIREYYRNKRSIYIYFFFKFDHFCRKYDMIICSNSKLEPKQIVFLTYMENKNFRNFVLEVEEEGKLENVKILLELFKNDRLVHFQNSPKICKKYCDISCQDRHGQFLNCIQNSRQNSK